MGKTRWGGGFYRLLCTTASSLVKRVINAWPEHLHFLAFSNKFYSLFCVRRYSRNKSVTSRVLRVFVVRHLSTCEHLIRTAFSTTLLYCTNRQKRREEQVCGPPPAIWFNRQHVKCTGFDHMNIRAANLLLSRLVHTILNTPTGSFSKRWSFCQGHG